MPSYTSNKFKEMLALGVINFDTHVFKIALMRSGFAFSRASHNGYADISTSELVTAFGYTVGGATLAGVIVTKSDILNAATISWNNVNWSATGGDLETGGAIVYDDTVAAPQAKPVIGFIDFGGTIVTYDGGTFTVANPTVAIR